MALSWTKINFEDWNSYRWLEEAPVARTYWSSEREFSFDINSRLLKLSKTYLKSRSSFLVILFIMTLNFDLIISLSDSGICFAFSLIALRRGLNSFSLTFNKVAISSSEYNGLSEFSSFLSFLITSVISCLT